MRRSPHKPVAFEEARARILGAVSPLGPERVSLQAARGRVLAEAVAAPRPHPPRDDSAMDGWAVRLEDLRGAAQRGVRLRVAAQASFPGAPEPPRLLPGEAVRIFTGGPVPAGADAVVRQEAAVEEEDAVRFWSEPAPGENIRRAGEDFAPGTVVIASGAVLGAGELTAIAAIGLAEVAVFRRPRVAVLTSGDELCEPGQPLQPGQIYDANAVGLSAMLDEAGAIPRCVGPARDDLASLCAALAEIADADALVSAAGISVGDRDLVGDALEEMGGRWHFRGVRMRPGKPASFGEVAGKPVFALSGNPAAALVAFETLVRPAILKMGGHIAVDRPRERASLEFPLSKKGGAITFVRGLARRAGQRLRFRPLDRQGAGMLSSMIGHNALAVLPAERIAFAAGELVEVALLSTPLEGAPVPVVAFVGPSGAGKTAGLESLLPVLCARGLRVAALKHDAHGFAMDREGKDTARLARAGAASVAVLGPGGAGAILGEPHADPADLVERLFPHADLVLAEGFHDAPWPKVVVLDGRGPEPRDLAATGVIAVVGGEIPGVPSLTPGDVEGLATRVLEAAGIG